jgi:hypothetical protein
MADMNTQLDVLSEGQSQKTTAINELFDPMSTAAIFGRRAATSAGLTWGYYGGTFRKTDGTYMAIANGTLTLPANDTVYVEVNGSGVVSQNTTGFSAGAIPLYQVTTGASTVTNYLDKRTGTQGSAVATGVMAVSHADITDWDEAVDDRVAALLQAAGLTLTYNDAGNLLTISLPTQPYDVGGAFGGKPAANAVLMRYPFPRSVTFPAGLTDSQGVAVTGAAAQTDFDIRKNGTSVGTMRFAASATTATFIMASQTVFAAGDILTIVAPATPDTTLADLGWSLAGTR